MLEASFQRITTYSDHSDLMYILCWRVAGLTVTSTLKFPPKVLLQLWHPLQTCPSSNILNFHKGQRNELQMERFF